MSDLPEMLLDLEADFEIMICSPDAELVPFLRQGGAPTALSIRNLQGLLGYSLRAGQALSALGLLSGPEDNWAPRVLCFSLYHVFVFKLLNISRIRCSVNIKQKINKLWC